MTKILVVDDEPGMRLTLKGILEKKGFTVALAEDGKEAVEAVQQARFDVVLMDMKMPVMGGAEAFLQIKKVCPETQVILMTGYVVESDIRRAEENGATVLTKPLDLKRVIELLQNPGGSSA